MNIKPGKNISNILLYKKKAYLKPKTIYFIAIIFLIIRNSPLCVSMPIWIFGDEMAHLDYALKLQKGHIPQPHDYIEPELFEFDKHHRDTRFVTDKITIPSNNVSELGFGGYSYAAKHPPLPHLIFNLARGIISPLHFSLLAQVKILRILTLLAVAAGIFFLYQGLKDAGCQNPAFYSPLLLIALLAQDTYFSINNDAFSFCFFSFSLAQMFLLISNPSSKRRWMLLSLGTILALWTKATNVLLFPLWLLLMLRFTRDNRRKKIIVLCLVSLAVVILVSSPWYIYNAIRFGGPFAFRYGTIPGEPDFSAYPPNWINLKTFVLAYTRTLFRGEMLWHGNYLDILPLELQNIILSLIPAILFLVASIPLGDPPHKDAGEVYFLRRGAIAVVAILMFGYFFLGTVPYYHARFSLGAVYLLMFMLAWGWKKILRSDSAAFFIPALLMMIYNVVFTGILLRNVMGPPLR